MKLYIAQVQWEMPYPCTKDLRVSASNYSAAAARALREWRKSVPRKQIKRVKLMLAPVSEVAVQNGSEVV